LCSYSIEEKISIIKKVLNRKTVLKIDLDPGGRFEKEFDNLNPICLKCKNICKQQNTLTLVSCKKFSKRQES